MCVCVLYMYYMHAHLPIISYTACCMSPVVYVADAHRICNLKTRRYARGPISDNEDNDDDCTTPSVPP